MYDLRNILTFYSLNWLRKNLKLTKYENQGAILDLAKGKLILKCPVGVFKSTKKANFFKDFCRLFKNYLISFFLFDPFLEAWEKILKKYSLVFW